MKLNLYLFFMPFVFIINTSIADTNIVVVPKDSIAPDKTGMRELNSVEFSKEMKVGWNLGNTLEAVGGETSWGNPMATQQFIDSVKAAGFTSIRIPVAWSQFSKEMKFTIMPSWLNRVETVVNYALKNNMYVVLNNHWDGGWMKPTYAEQAYVNNRLAVIWQQIAVRFRNYDDRLLFAGTNEVMFEGDYGTPKEEYYTVQNTFNQTFINTVRATGGRNTYRHLIVQGFNTNIDHCVNFLKIPTDPTPNRMMIEVHYYDPYNFTINENNVTITQWGKNATDPKKVETWANEEFADKQFQKMKTNYVDKGYGVIIGEYGILARLTLGSVKLNDEYAMYRKYYLEYITKSILSHSLVPFYWDNGYTGDKAMGLFERARGKRAYPDIIKVITQQ